MKKIKIDYAIKNKINEEDLKDNPDKVKRTFINNISTNEILRRDIWIKLYWDKKAKKEFRNNQELMIKANEEQFKSMNQKEKEDWYDFITNNNSSLGIVQELNFIVNSLKDSKGNMKKVWSDLKLYGKIKKENKNESK